MPIVVLSLTALAVRDRAGQGRRLAIPARMASARSCTPSPRRATTTAAPSPALGANTLFYNTTGGLAMLIGRFWLAVPTLAMAGALAPRSGCRPARARCPRTRPMFVGWLIAIVLAGQCAQLRARPGAGPDRRTPDDDWRLISIRKQVMTIQLKHLRIRRRRLRRQFYQRAIRDSFVKLDPRLWCATRSCSWSRSAVC